MRELKNFLHQNLGYITVTLVCAVFMATAFVQMGRTGKTVGEIVSESALMFFLGIFVNYILDIQGIINGERDPRVIKTQELHSEVVERVSPFIERLDGWCREQNAEAQRMQRTRILAAGGLKYSECFDEDGRALPFAVNKEALRDKYKREDEMRRIRAHRRAVRLRLTSLCPSELTSEGGRRDDPFYMGRTKAQYEREMSIRDIFSKIATAGILGYFGVELITDFDPAVLIWRGMQVAVLLVMGILKMLKSQMYMTDEYRGRVVKKIDHLIKFENYIKTEDREKCREHITEAATS